MLDIGFQELIIIMVLALLVFGPERLPELGRKLGRAMREFRRASDEFRSTVETNLQLHEESILAHPADLVSEPAPAPADASSASPGVDGAEAPISGAEAPATIQAPASEPDEPFWTRRGGDSCTGRRAPGGSGFPRPSASR